MNNYSKTNMWKSNEYRIRVVSLIAWDIIMIHLASLIALAIRFDLAFTKVDPVFFDVLSKYSIVHTMLTIGIFILFQLYTSLWVYAGMRELFNIILAGVTTSLVQYIGVSMMGMTLPRSYYLIYPTVLITFTTIGRFGYRTMRQLRLQFNKQKKKDAAVKTMLIGAGAAGSMLLHEMRTSKHINYNVCCVIDDDPSKIGTSILSVPIIGGQDMIPAAVERYDIEEIIVAIPTLTGKERKKILDICAETGCKLKSVPGYYQIVNNEVTVSQLRKIEIEDLLGREPVRIDNHAILGYVENQVILVTGGGGSIGSEICRQIASHNPKHLVIVDNYENNVYDLQMELIKEYPQLKLSVLIASVQSRDRIAQIFDEYKPDVIFHAAAHKHVPLMEDSPCESIKNNVIGTYNVAFEANRTKAKTMVLISTDKAVRPTNIMGASKRLCELILQSFNNMSDTNYAAVRFGNVLGSNGSVIPLFKKQIEQGGPVTVTHKDIIRYFMTIPEAVSLVLQAGAFAKGGEIFILDMGEPVKILDLAENMIRLSGLRPGIDIEIKFVGLRPGEKLYEELLIDDDNRRETANSRIFIGSPVPFENEKEFWKKLTELKEVAFRNDPNVRAYVKAIVPEYTYKEKE